MYPANLFTQLLIHTFIAQGLDFCQKHSAVLAGGIIFQIVYNVLQAVAVIINAIKMRPHFTVTLIDLLNFIYNFFGHFPFIQNVIQACLDRP